VQCEKWLAEGQVFEKEILSGAEDAVHPADEVPECGDHKQKSYPDDGSPFFATLSLYEGARF
jgi:hypothetical protein